MGTAQARVAPTVKIEDDAVFPRPSQPQVSRPQPAAFPLFPPIAPASQPPIDAMPRTASQPPVASMARSVPMNQAPAHAYGQTQAQQAQQMPQPQSQGSQPRTPAARPSGKPIARPSAPAVLDESADALPRSGRRWGLIVLILIIDLGLAGSGGFMLWRGLGLGL